MFEAPIPGQSLTKTPKNNPWERPPETADPDEAIVHHLTRLSDPKIIDNVMDAVSTGMPLSMITDLMLTGGVANGIHSLDISMMIAPVVQEHLKTIVDEAGVEYKEFFEEDDGSSQKKNVARVKALEAIKATPKEEQDEGYEMMTEILSQEEKPKEGFMKRRKAQ